MEAALQAVPSFDASVEPFLGEIRLLAGTYAPSGWTLCRGQLLPVRKHLALFSLLGTRFGGDGELHFALPDYRYAPEPAPNFIIALEGRYPPRP